MSCSLKDGASVCCPLSVAANFACFYVVLINFPPRVTYVLNIINDSLANDIVLPSLKHAVVTLNFWPISKLPFLSRVLKKSVYYQLNLYL